MNFSDHLNKDVNIAAYDYEIEPHYPDEEYDYGMEPHYPDGAATDEDLTNFFLDYWNDLTNESLCNGVNRSNINHVAGWWENKAGYTAAQVACGWAGARKKWPIEHLSRGRNIKNFP